MNPVRTPTRTFVRVLFWTLAATLLATFLGLSSAHASNSSPHPSHHPSHSRVWHEAHLVLRHQHVPHALPWTGRYRILTHPHHKTFCDEVFNPHRRDVRFHHLVPSGSYLLICDDGRYRFRDGSPFPHTHAY